MGGQFTTSQLKEELRFHLPEVIFLCEIKNKNAFVQAVCEKLRWITNWKIMDLRGLSGGILLGWSQQIQVKQVVSNDFCFEVEIEEVNHPGTFWGIFVYASPDKQLRQDQWQYLIQQKQCWGQKLFLGGT